MVFLLTVENHPIAVALNPGFVSDEGLRKVVNGYVYAMGAKLIFDDRGDDLPVTARQAGANSGHVDAGVVFDCKRADPSRCGGLEVNLLSCVCVRSGR